MLFDLRSHLFRSDYPGTGSRIGPEKSNIFLFPVDNKVASLRVIPPYFSIVNTWQYLGMYQYLYTC